MGIELHLKAPDVLLVQAHSDVNPENRTGCIWQRKVMRRRGFWSNWGWGVVDRVVLTQL